MYRLHVVGQPASVPNDLVFRIAPDGAMGAKELAVQRTVASQGFPTPQIHLSGPADDHLDGAWSVMDFADGSSPLSDLNGFGAIRSARRLLRDLPRVLATAMARLHALDPGPTTAAITDDAPTVAWRVEDLLEHFGGAASAFGRVDLVQAVDRLAAARPAGEQTVVCHGDLHPFNLLIDAAGHTTVVDWTGAICAEPAYDVAFTALLLANPPLDAPGPLSAVIARVGRVLSRRFIAAYRSLAPEADLDPVGWYQGLHGARILLDAAAHEAVHGAGRDGHPFAALVPAATAAVGAATGVTTQATH
jgi:aminoglycoside phosphotransferase (APT) family kinase protein